MLILTKILAIVELVPLIQKVLDFLAIQYAKHRIEAGNEKFISALDRARLHGSVIELRDELGRVSPEKRKG